MEWNGNTKINIFSLNLLIGICLSFWYQILSVVFCEGIWLVLYILQLTISLQGRRFT